MGLTPDEIAWTVDRDGPGVQQTISSVKSRLGDEAYANNVMALRRFLTQYFTAGSGDCAGKQGSSISPLDSTPDGGKVLKVRWALPGSGKSGGLRLGLAVYCEERRVVLGYAEVCKNDPDTDQLLDALREAEERLTQS